MARPREFDTDTALDAARDTFWCLGYEATTLDDLTAAMGISKPSLYNAFGDKEALFLTVLGRYADTYGAEIAAMDDEPDGREAVGAFLVGAARGLAASGATGCFRVGHTALAGAHEPALAEALTEAHRAFEMGIEARLTRAQRDGQLGLAENPAVLAAFFAGTISALAVRARVERDEAVLVGMAETALRVWARE